MIALAERNDGGPAGYRDRMALFTSTGVGRIG